MESQTVIKVILIVAFAAFAVFLMLPGRGARHLAIRRLVMILILALTIVAVIFPDALNRVAHAVGVGRGADLLLYGFIVVFLGNALVQQRRSRHIEQEITKLARRLAIAEAELPPAPAPQQAGNPAVPVAQPVPPSTESADSPNPDAAD